MFELIPISTRRLVPPRDDLFPVLECLPPLIDGDILVITSKVLAIHQGRCERRTSDTSALSLAIQEADRYVLVQGGYLLGQKYGALLPNSGVDESNGNGYYILLPVDIPDLLEQVRSRLRSKWGLSKFGIIVTDSCTLPLRKGLIGISIAHIGVRALVDYRGLPDLFGRPMLLSQSNIVDSLAAVSVLIMGEGAESRPFVLIRGSEFACEDGEPCGHLLAEPREDLFTPLLETMRH
jgi:dihydrofolate synthase / folylpolyglutamate synthase